MKLSEEVVEYIERWGRHWERAGASRTQGRMLGFLIVCDPPHQSSADLAATLQVSAGSVSTVTRQLMTLGLVERKTFPGDRASYFQIPEGAWFRLMQGELARIQALVELARDGRPLMPSVRKDRVQDLVELGEFWLEEWPKVFARLESRLRGKPDAGH